MALNQACRRLSRDLLLTLSDRRVGALQPGVRETISQLHLHRRSCGGRDVHFRLHSLVYHLLQRRSSAVLSTLGKVQL